jgi:hypothetical protein
MKRPPGKFMAWSALILAVVLILHWKHSQGENEEARQALMAKQRAVEVELGPRWYPLRDQIERWAVELATGPADDVVDQDGFRALEFRDKPGVYLRLPASQAQSAEAIRKHAKGSLKDAFTACLMRVENPSPLEGKPCEKSRDCPAGELCNEMDHCSAPSQPYNLRVAYRTLHVLSDQFVRDVQDASTDLRLRLLEGMFEDATRDDIPVAVDLVTRARYFLVVVDERPEPEGSARADATEPPGVFPARVGLWRLEDGKNLLRLRRTPEANLAGNIPENLRAAAARLRQAQSCALALEVRKAIEPAEKEPDAPAPVDPAAPVGD